MSSDEEILTAARILGPSTAAELGSRVKLPVSTIRRKAEYLAKRGELIKGGEKYSIPRPPKNSGATTRTKQCPRCERVSLTTEAIAKDFGFRTVRGRKVPQSYCRTCKLEHARLKRKSKS